MKHSTPKAISNDKIRYREEPIRDECPAVKERFESILDTNGGSYICLECRQKFDFDFPKTSSFGDALARIDRVLETHLLRHDLSRYGAKP
jgi:hypothetical protein